MFTAPLWLYALAALAIPLALHLWSRRPRQVIRVGSLRHVNDLAEARSWSARLTQPLLLLLRLGIIASVVLALAGPRIGTDRFDGRVSQMVLVEPALLTDSALVRNDPLLDSLTRSRVTVRLLTSGLPRLQLDGWNAEYLVDVPRQQSGRIWDLLVAADRLTSPGGHLLVIARPRVTWLGGKRPALRAQVSWHVPIVSERAEWLAGRWPIASDSTLEVSGLGSARGTVYHSRTLAGTTESTCAGCERAPVMVRVQSPDSAARRRLHLAALAVGTLLGQTVELAPATEKAGLILTTAPFSDSLLDGSGPVAAMTPAVARSGALADTVLAHWPWNPVGLDRKDPREASLAQAMPGSETGRNREPRDARAPLLLLGLMLFALERWLATRPRGSAA